MYTYWLIRVTENDYMKSISGCRIRQCISKRAFVWSLCITTLLTVGLLMLMRKITLKSSCDYATQKTVIIQIDASSLDRLGPWPIPRRLHALAIDRLTKAGSLAIIYDVSMLQPSGSPGDDLLLNRAIESSGRVVMPSADVAPSPPIRHLYIASDNVLGSQRDGRLRTFDEIQSLPTCGAVAGAIAASQSIESLRSFKAWLPPTRLAFETVRFSDIVDSSVNIEDSKFRGKLVVVELTFPAFTFREDRKNNQLSTGEAHAFLAAMILRANKRAE